MAVMKIKNRNFISYCKYDPPNSTHNFKLIAAINIRILKTLCWKWTSLSSPRKFRQLRLKSEVWANAEESDQIQLNSEKDDQIPTYFDKFRHIPRFRKIPADHTIPTIFFYSFQRLSNFSQNSDIPTFRLTSHSWFTSLNSLQSVIFNIRKNA